MQEYLEDLEKEFRKQLEIFKVNTPGIPSVEYGLCFTMKYRTFTKKCVTV